MGVQLKIVSKKEAYKLIDEVPGDSILIIKYNDILGISNCGKHIKKRKGKKMV